MSKKIESEDLKFLKSLTDEQKNKYYKKSIMYFILLHLFLIPIGVYISVLDIYHIFVEFSYSFNRGWGILLIPLCLYSLIDYLRLSRDGKILRIYKLINNRHVIKDNKTRFLIWLAVILILVATICPFFFILIANKYFNPWLLLLLVSGIFVSSLIWYCALSKKEDK